MEPKTEFNERKIPWMQGIASLGRRENVQETETRETESSKSSIGALPLRAKAHSITTSEDREQQGNNWLNCPNHIETLFSVKQILALLRPASEQRQARSTICFSRTTLRTSHLPASCAGREDGNENRGCYHDVGAKRVQSENADSRLDGGRLTHSIAVQTTLTRFILCLPPSCWLLPATPCV